MATDVQVHLFAAARAAAGVSEVTVDADSLAQVLERLVEQSPALAEVLPRCSYLVDGIAAKPSGGQSGLSDGCRIDVLPPFAGG